MVRFSKRLQVNHGPAQLFDLVADVERYPEFVPWVTAVRVRRREGQTIFVDMTMGAGIVGKQFSTMATLDRPRRIEITGTDAFFERFEQRWTFEPSLEASTAVEYQVEIAFRSRMLEKLVGASLGEGTKAMMAAFVRRANRLYGPSSV